MNCSEIYAVFHKTLTIIIVYSQNFKAPYYYDVVVINIIDDRRNFKSRSMEVPVINFFKHRSAFVRVRLTCNSSEREENVRTAVYLHLQTIQTQYTLIAKGI